MSADDFWSFYRSRIGNATREKIAAVPDFLVISPAKTGTTWLARHLASHPEVFIPPEKEVRYFDIYWRFRSIDWYLDKFAEARHRIKGEASPSTAWLPRQAIELIQKLNPRLKLIVLARRQPERAWSHARHGFRYQDGTFRKCTGPFESMRREVARDLLSDRSLSASDYAGIIRRWMLFFPSSQFHVRYFEDAMSAPEQYLRDTFSFLGLPDCIDFRGVNLKETVNPGIAIPWDKSAESVLADIYSERQLETEHFLARTFNLKSPWAPTVRHGVTSPIHIQNLADGWQVYFYQGVFHGLQIAGGSRNNGNLCTTLCDSDGPGVIRSPFHGDLLKQIKRSTAPNQELEDHRLQRVLSDLFVDFRHSNNARLLGSYRGFNHVSHRGRIYGLRQSLGPIDLTVDSKEKLRTYAAEDVVVGKTITEVEARIDQIEDRTRRRRHGRALPRAERNGKARRRSMLLRFRMRVALAELRLWISKVERILQSHQ